MHGVGLGEVLALRGLILSLLDQQPELSFLVTSSTKTSAEVFSKNTTPNTIHQFLPLDAMAFITKFLDHWQPQLSVWAEQDLWPAMVTETHRRNIPLTIVNARMNEKSYESRLKVKNLYSDLYKRFHSISTQEKTTARHMNLLGASAIVGGSLKAAAIPLQDNPDKRIEFSNSIAGRTCWLLASSHAEDETVALTAHQQLLKSHPQALLVIAPRLIDRKQDIINQCIEFNMSVATRSNNTLPGQHHNIYLADTFGEMGIWYRLSMAAFIGGSMGPVQGHNPWEAIALGCAVIHGPNVDNFANDYATLQKCNAALAISNAEQLLQCLRRDDQLQDANNNAKNLLADQNKPIDSIANMLLATLQSAEN